MNKNAFQRRKVGRMKRYSHALEFSSQNVQCPNVPPIWPAHEKGMISYDVFRYNEDKGNVTSQRQ